MIAPPTRRAAPRLIEWFMSFDSPLPVCFNLKFQLFKLHGCTMAALADSKCGWCIGTDNRGRCFAKTSASGVQCASRGVFATTAAACPTVRKCNRSTT
jgi:hypothetical protein